MPNIPEINLEPKSDREILMMVAQQVNFLTQVQIPEITRTAREAREDINTNCKRIDKLDGCLREVKYKAGINGNAVSTGQRIKINAESKSGIAAILIMGIYKLGNIVGWW